MSHGQLTDLVVIAWATRGSGNQPSVPPFRTTTIGHHERISRRCWRLVAALLTRHGVERHGFSSGERDRVRLIGRRAERATAWEARERRVGPVSAGECQDGGMSNWHDDLEALQELFVRPFATIGRGEENGKVGKTVGRPLGLKVGGWVLVCNCVSVQVVLQPSYVDYSTTTGQEWCL